MSHPGVTPAEMSLAIPEKGFYVTFEYVSPSH